MALLQRHAHWSWARTLFGGPSIQHPIKEVTALRPWSFVSALPVVGISISIPGILSDIWEGILRAVPKKKTSHMKRRHRQLAGKALKDVTAINSCPGCGRPKKAHHLCPYCVAEIKQGWGGKSSAMNANNAHLREKRGPHKPSDWKPKTAPKPKPTSESKSTSTPKPASTPKPVSPSTK